MTPPVQRLEVPVLVVGGGPVGLMAAILLARHGVRSRIVERRPSPQRAPAAHVVSARTFEICRAAGVDGEAIRAACADPADAGYVRWVTHLAGAGSEEVGHLPFEQQGREALAHTPTPLRNLAQHRFEPILLDALQKAPEAGIAYGHAWEGAEADDEGVTSRVRDLARDTVYEVRSRWLLGADGAGSPVRKSVGIAMDGPAKIEAFVMIHVRANLRALVRERPAILYWILDPEVGGTLVAHDIDREWVYMRPLAEGESTADYPPARCEAMVRRAIGPAASEGVPLAIEHVGTWVMTAQLAERYRDGRIFLVGDAAHRFPPTGGLGLNTGVQDAHALAWRIAAVEAAWAPPSLLDGYERERRPVARNNADQSLRNAFRMLEVPRALGTIDAPTTARMRETLADPTARRAVEAAIAQQAEHFDMPGLQLGYVYADGNLVPEAAAAGPASGAEPASTTRSYVPSARPGARMPHAWLERDGARVSTLDLLWPEGFTLVTQVEDAGWRDAAAAAADGVPLRCTGVDAAGGEAGARWARLAGLEAGGALLVRPDQHVAWRTRTRPADPTAALRAALRRTLWG